MNKKKIIFLSWVGIVIFLLLVFAIFVSSSWNKTKKTSNLKDLTIWTFNTNKDNFNSFLDDFKKDTKNTNLNIKVENFTDYEEYNLALASAFAKWEAPDIFMLNNNEKSLFLEQATWIDPNIVSVDNLRTDFKWFFGDDLIMSINNWDKKIEFLMWVPVWYEPLGIFYNIKKIPNQKDLQNFSYIANLIRQKARDWFAVIGIWWWRTVKFVWDILAQFFMWIWKNSITSISSTDVKNVLTDYEQYFSWDNNYEEIDTNLFIKQQNNIDAFIDWKIWAIFAYPRVILDIDDKWFSKRLLRAVSFPEFINESKYLIDYNYFLLNKNTKNIEASYAFLSYIFSEFWEKKYLNHFKYLLPARTWLYDELKDDFINDNFFVKRKNFYNSTIEYSSFDKWIKFIYDNNTKNILDIKENTKSIFDSFITSLKCKTKKILKLENLSNNCG